MSLILGDNFSYQGAKPLDKRNQYDTVAAMAAVSDTVLYDGCLTFCLETGKTYQWLSTNTVDATLGKWREFSSGGGGSSDLAGLDDVDITAAAAGQILKYDDTEQKWVNSDQTIEIIEMSKAEFDELPTSEKNNGKAYFIPDAQGSEGGGGTTYTAGDGINITDDQISTDNMLSTDMEEVASPLPGVMSRLPVLFDESGAERVVGWYKYANGTKKPVYEKSYVSSYSGNIRQWQTIETFTGAADNIDSIIYQRVFCITNNGATKEGTAYNRIIIRSDGNDITFEASDALSGVSNIRGIIQYTKTTDTAS